ncbi:MAG: HlyD family type I secretion periplasmic adaptor subunit [Pseudomonadota bacterium]
MNISIPRIRTLLEKLEGHPRLARAVEAIDNFVQLLSNKDYKGNNSAIASAHAPMRATALVITAITFITIVFGMIVPIESAAIAHGNVAVITKRKTVQHLEGGIIKNILVEEGQLVKKDQPLVEISDVAPKANREIVQSELWAMRASETRIQALQSSTAELKFPDELEEAAKNQESLQKAMRSQAELFTTQNDSHLGKLDSLWQRISGIKEEIIGLTAQKKSAHGQLALIIEETNSVKELYKDGMATKPRLLELQRKAEELKGNIGQYGAQIAKAEQSITESQMDVINLENDFAGKLAEELRDVRSKINDYDEKLRAATDVMTRTVIISPSEGIVTGLKHHTIGGVIAAGAPIMDITPQGDKLVAEVHVQPTDIDVVEAGMQARIVLSAYKSRRMPILTGKVTQVSADAFNEQQGIQTVSYYTARVEVDAKELAALDSAVKLSPGMPLEVYINTGSRSFFSYMLAPITDSLNKAFKED